MCIRDRSLSLRQKVAVGYADFLLQMIERHIFSRSSDRHCIKVHSLHALRAQKRRLDSQNAAACADV